MTALLSLSAPVGEGQDNLDADVFATDQALRAIGEREDDDLDKSLTLSPGLLTPGLSTSVGNHQARNGLHEDGILKPGGPTERSLNNRLLQKPAGAGLLDAQPLNLTSAVGNDHENHGPDVVQVKKTLGGLGLMAEDPFDRPNPFIDAPTTRGLRAFQRAKDLKEDGVTTPGGETERALRGAVNNLAKSFGPEWRAIQKRKAAAEDRVRTAETSGGGLPAPAQNTGFQNAAMTKFPRQRTEGRDITALGSLIGGAFEAGPVDPSPDLKRDRFPAHPRGSIKGPPHTGHRNPIIPTPPMVGPDPDNARRKPGSTAHTSPPPKMPTKTVLPQRTPPGLRDSILINPDQRDELRIPIWVENRKGSPATQELNNRAGAILTKKARKIFPDGKVTHIGGGAEPEEYIQNRDRSDTKPRTTHGSSYPDYTIEIEHRGEKFIIHVDTYTSKRRDKSPVAREDRQFNRLRYNEIRRTFFLRIPKPQKGRDIAWPKLEKYTELFLKRIKRGIDTGQISGGKRTDVVRFFRILRPGK